MPMKAIVQLWCSQQPGTDGEHTTFVWIAKWLNCGSCLRAYGVEHSVSCGEARAPTARQAVRSIMSEILARIPDIPVMLVDEDTQSVEDLFSQRPDGSELTRSPEGHESEGSDMPPKDANTANILTLPPAGARKKGVSDAHPDERRRC